MRKYLYLEIDTTGPEHLIHGVHKISGIVELNGRIKEVFEIKCRPHEKAHYSESSLEASGITENELLKLPDPKKALAELTEILDKYIDTYDKTDKFTIIGYGVSFHIQFLYTWWNRSGGQYLGSYVDLRFPIDVRMVITSMRAWGDVFCNVLDNSKLVTVAGKLGINIDNNICSKIIATRKVYHRLLLMLKDNFKKKYNTEG